MFFFKTKYSAGQALLKNLDVKETLLKKTEEQQKNSVVIDSLKKQIDDLHSQHKEGNITDEELANWLNDFFNGSKR